MEGPNGNLSEVESITYDSDENRRVLDEVPGKKSSLWSLLRPQTKDRLFHIILISPNLSDSVKLWLSEFNADRERIVTDFIQLIVDIASYQFIDVEEFIHDYEITQLVPYMENTENTVISQTGKYFLKCTTKSYAMKHEKIGKFIVETIKEFGLHYKLFESSYNFNKYCFRIIRNMCKSKRRSIRHTGFFIGVKYMTGVVELLHDLNEKLSEYVREIREEQNNEQRGRMQARYNHLTMTVTRIQVYIKHLFSVLRDENMLNDTELNSLKKIFAKEIRRWFFSVPIVFKELDAMKVLMSFLRNHDKDVRMTALIELGTVLERLYKDYADRYPEIVGEINSRVYDIDLKIATVAVQILNFLHDQEPSWVSNDMRDSILGRVYCYDYTLAFACGKFLISVFHMASKDVNSVIGQLVKFEMTSNYRGIYERTPLLVEAVLEVLPALQDLTVYKTFLETKALDDVALNVFVKIVAEVAYQLITGSCSYMRSNSPKKNYSVDTLELYSVLEDIIIMLWNLRVSKPVILKPIILVYKKFFIDNNSSVNATNLISVSSVKC